ncbi:PRC-barrel domain-containing protein [Undibacterium sp. KW1]|uniref:PRC-barrel domain-containing protein n=1 Tax=Undibacterium sp. KW1 TaxID=2058624 RepID=UPI00351B9786
MIDINSNIYDTGPGNNDHKGPGPELMGARTLTGDNVVNHADEYLGEVKEIMLDMQAGRIAYVVVAHGGLLGIGEKLFAIPWTALTLDTVNKRFILNIKKAISTMPRALILSSGQTWQMKFGWIQYTPITARKHEAVIS